MKISGWGNYPRIEAEIISIDSVKKLKGYLKDSESLIPRGLGRSYGDSSLNTDVISTLKLNRILAFEEKEGIVRGESGVSFKEILDIFVPRGWFLPVTPGTKFVTVGGAIASDVHGKNHHKEGTFSDHLISMDIMLPDGEIVTCSKTSNSDIFKATCGGMGLTGVILNATFKLKKIESAYIKQKTIKAKDLEEIMDLFEKHNDSTYSVAWIDCLGKSKGLCRGILMLGEHATLEDIKNLDISKNPLILKEKKRLNIPFSFPNFALNKLVVRGYNFLYYSKYPDGVHESIVDYDAFFCHLDSIHNWNRIYGARGFTQYQFVLPKDASKEGLEKILTAVSNSNMGLFLAVLKLFGKGNNNLLSFPMEGYTLTMDFPINPRLFSFLNKLDKIVLDYAGRLYLTKDVRMGEEMFKKSYGNAERFVNFKDSIDRDNKFRSLQSIRIGV